MVQSQPMTPQEAAEAAGYDSPEEAGITKDKPRPSIEHGPGVFDTIKRIDYGQIGENAIGNVKDVLSLRAPDNTQGQDFNPAGIDLTGELLPVLVAIGGILVLLEFEF